MLLKLVATAIIHSLDLSVDFSETSIALLCLLAAISGIWDNIVFSILILQMSLSNHCPHMLHGFQFLTLLNHQFCLCFNVIATFFG